MTQRSAKISLTSDGAGVIEVDDQRLHGVRSLTLTSEAGETPTLTLELRLYDVSTMAEALVLIDDHTAETLVALGWKPPPEQEVDGAAP